MEKLFIVVGISLFAFSCSSDNKDIEEPLPPKPLTQYEVDYKISNEEIEAYPLGGRNTKTFVLDKSKDARLGNLGVIVHHHNSLEVGYTAYDACCPIHWEDTDPLKHKLKILPSDPSILEVTCDIDKNNRSSFNLRDGEPTEGYAREKKINLVKYNIKVYPENKYPEYLPAEGQHITNPNYKK